MGMSAAGHPPSAGKSDAAGGIGDDDDDDGGGGGGGRRAILDSAAAATAAAQSLTPAKMIDGVDVSGVQEKASQMLSDSAERFSSYVKVLASEAGAGAAQIEEVVAAGRSQAEEKLQEFKSVYKHYEDLVFSHLHSAAHYAIVERPVVGIASGVVVSSLILGFPQRMVKRAVFGMWGEAAVLQRIEARAVDMKERMSQYSAEAKKLAERAAMAEDEVLQGMKKLKAAKAQIETLRNNVQKSGDAGHGIISDLRFLKAGGALALRSDVAKQISETRTLSKSLDSSLRRAEMVLRS